MIAARVVALLGGAECRNADDLVHLSLSVDVDLLHDARFVAEDRSVDSITAVGEALIARAISSGVAGSAPRPIAK